MTNKEQSGRQLTWLAIISLAAITCNDAVAESAAVQRGRAFALVNCSRCHSINRFTQSPLSIAPPFRSLHLRYPVDSLEEALAEGISTGHPTMPEFQLDPGQVDGFIAFLKSLEK